MSWIMGKLLKILMLKSKAFFQGNQNISRNLYEKSRGGENIYFLKLQRDQLKMLRQRILSRKDQITTKMIKVDTQIQSLEKAKTEDKKFKIPDN